jgi:ATP-dependent Clp protease, protease subunit
VGESGRSTAEFNRTRRFSERAPAGTPSGDADAPCGWLPSLTFHVSQQPHIVRTLIPLLLIGVAAAFLQGCYTPQTGPRSEQWAQHADPRVDFSDPVLANRQIILCGLIDQRAAQETIEKLLFLDAKSHDPIDLLLHTPGGEIKHAMAIEQAMRLVRSPVNTCALFECNSGGAVLLAAGTGKRKAFRGAVIVVHGLTSHGKPPPDFTKLIQDTYTQFWRTRARLPNSWLPMPPGVLHFLSVEQALEYGLVDEIVDR